MKKERIISYFFGIKENGSLSDKDVICEILSEVLKLDGSRHVEEVFRVGRFSAEKIRPIRVKMSGVDSKKEILQRAKSLRSGMFDKVFIAPDLTEKQQVVDKDLREHVKTFRDEFNDQTEQEVKIRIKGGKVIKTESGKQDVVLCDPRKLVKKD